MTDSKASKTNNFHCDYMEKQFLSCSFNLSQMASSTGYRVRSCVVVFAMSCDIHQSKYFSLHTLVQLRKRAIQAKKWQQKWQQLQTFY